MQLWQFAASFCLIVSPLGYGFAISLHRLAVNRASLSLYFGIAMLQCSLRVAPLSAPWASDVSFQPSQAQPSCLEAMSCCGFQPAQACVACMLSVLHGVVQL